MSCTTTRTLDDQGIADHTYDRFFSRVKRVRVHASQAKEGRHWRCGTRNEGYRARCVHAPIAVGEPDIPLVILVSIPIFTDQTRGRHVE